MTSLTTTTPAEQFRAKSTGLLIDVANMTLHQLVDEFQRLADVMDENYVESEKRGFYLNDTGELARREQNVVNGAAKARFGISFDAHDRKYESGW